MCTSEHEALHQPAHSSASESDACNRNANKSMADKLVFPSSSPASWTELPTDLVEAVGAELTDATHAHSASLVCKGWRGVMHGLQGMELDMHTDPERWGRRLAGVASSVRALRSATVYINTSISSNLLARNIGMLGQQLASLEELHLRLSDAAELGGEAGRALGTLGSQLRSFTLTGGSLGPGAAMQLLVGLAQPGRLERLSILPSTRGLGDEELKVVGACPSLVSLEFRAHRLTGAGLEALTPLAKLARLVITCLESDSGYELSSLARMTALQQIDLAIDHGGGGGGGGSGAPTGPLGPLGALGSSSSSSAPTGGTGGSTSTCSTAAAAESSPTSALQVGPIAAAAGAPGLLGMSSRATETGATHGYSSDQGEPGSESPTGAELSLHFRWTDRVAKLLQACRAQLLQSLTSLDMGACRVSSSAVFGALAELTALRNLQMSCYSNSDTQVLCELSQFSRLVSLQALKLAKQAAYFPQHRRFRASTISVPVTQHTVEVLASRWASTLRELRLGLSRNDFTRDGLLALQHFTRLRSLAIIVEGGAASSSSNSLSTEATGVAGDVGAEAGQDTHSSEAMGAMLSSSSAPCGLPAAVSGSTLEEHLPGNQQGASGQSHTLLAGQLPPLGPPQVHRSPPMPIPQASGPESGDGAHTRSLPHTSFSCSPTLPWHSGLSSMSLGAAPLAPAVPHGLSAARSASPSALSRSPPSGAPAGPGVTALPPDVVVMDLRTLPPQLEELDLSGVALQVQGPLPAPVQRPLPAQQGLPSPGQQEVQEVAPMAAVLSTSPGYTGRAGLPPPGSSSASLSVSSSIPSLVTLSLENCLVRGSTLPLIAAALAPTLVSLSLVSLGGLNNGNLARVSVLTRLTSLTLFAPTNPHVTQASLGALAPLRGLRHLSWDSDDLTNSGPVLPAFTPFTALRMLSLSCTLGTLRRAVPGGLASFAVHMPFCYVDVVGGSTQPEAAAVQIHDDDEE